MNRTNAVSRQARDSAKKTAANTPTGTAMTNVNATRVALPTKAFLRPPTEPVEGGCGVLVKKSKLIDEAPFQMMKPRIRNSGTIATTKQAPSAPVIVPFTTEFHRAREGE